MNMKLRPNPNLTQLRISDNQYIHPWYRHIEQTELRKPNPPSKEAVERARFVDKTYHWDRNSSN